MLRGFEHEAGALALPWDIQRADEVAPLLAHVADPARRALAERAMARFTEHARPALPGLRAQAIHNDLNLYNVLVDPRDHDVIAGILDFGDMVRAPLVNDLAVAASYQLEPAPIRWRQPFASPPPITRSARSRKPSWMCCST